MLLDQMGALQAAAAEKTEADMAHARQLVDLVASSLLSASAKPCKSCQATYAQASVTLSWRPVPHSPRRSYSILAVHDCDCHPSTLSTTQAGARTSRILTRQPSMC
jgi:hypothetical protein